ncbi:MAG: hypothetical protein QNJ41_02200 [Xenococcaceae cyanobacterium MO_188.B32]|nr:hypothetical protein [Xenococcaceae cyanobacterium MO_188.B32]
MFLSKYFKPATSLITVLTIGASGIIPMVNLAPVSAQLFPSENRTRRTDRNRVYSVIPEGTQIPVEFEKEKILVTKTETAPITLTVAANIRDRYRNTLIPYGAEISGQIEPAGEGSRFVAEELIFPDGTSQYINADSKIITRTETVKRGADTGDILTGAAIGGAAAVVLGDLFGDINIEEVLGGAGIGALGGLLLGGKEVELISIDPERDLDLTLQSDLALR